MPRQLLLSSPTPAVHRPHHTVVNAQVPPLRLTPGLVHVGETYVTSHAAYTVVKVPTCNPNPPSKHTIAFSCSPACDISSSGCCLPFPDRPFRAQINKRCPQCRRVGCMPYLQGGSGTRTCHRACWLSAVNPSCVNNCSHLQCMRCTG
jgi:hypothetical protein